MDFAELQDVIERTYGDRDRQRGVSASVAWQTEEIGELAQAVRKGTHEQRVHEFGDVVAWVATLANQQGVDLNEAVARYGAGCPKCSSIPCVC
jgi:NTP pyrophosphatase (non-canonical NTP hydrolase)